MLHTATDECESELDRKKMQGNEGLHKKAHELVRIADGHLVKLCHDDLLRTSFDGRLRMQCSVLYSIMIHHDALFSPQVRGGEDSKSVRKALKRRATVAVNVKEPFFFPPGGEAMSNDEASKIPTATTVP